MHGQQFLQRAAQVFQVKRIRAVGFGFLGIIVNFHENSVDARGNRCA